MAKASPIDIESELVQAKARRGHGFVEGSYYETMSRLATLERSLAKLGTEADAELYRHFPVAAISALETHFKVTVATIIDSGSPYLERGLALGRDKLMSVAEVLPLLNRRNVSAGDLVSHVLPFNSVASLERTFSMLFDEELKSLAKRVEDPYLLRAKLRTGGLIIEDVATLWAGLAKTFERRHILAHESASQYTVTFDDAKLALTSIAQFAKLIDAILWMTIWKDRPLTQYEMNMSAAKQTRDTRAILAARVRKALRISTEDGQRARFRSMYRAWRHYFGAWIEWQDEHFITGSIRPLFAATNRTLAYKCQIKELSNWMANMRLGDPPEPDIDL
ncbi:hypothetical protein F6X40_40395 [Paraburkholderia sp. UCT31]|uniref:hypothetical protein n=1 Tax=Paraburkholderia sp. UCT31 TaxID=2615209 RepID=UPI0016551BC7|nr:hypothetical protein [Paraburkholderia sp. UCT31]MBC8742742.1 hypothetical protein [Paraburkholderia sp. UCT31]